MNELDRKRDALAPAGPGGKASPPLAGDSSRCGSEHGLREGGSGSGPLGATTGADRATRHLETSQGILSYTQLAPLLAEEVLRVETDIYAGTFAAWPIDETLLAEFHRRICGTLVPAWAGRWRTIEVTVGNLQPPPATQVPTRMRDYGRDLMARWDEASRTTGELTLELLAFAEGRFLTIHPFRDFNGRTIRLFLLELLRRLDLPRVVLAPSGDADRQVYFAALEAADRSHWRPLMDFWTGRLAQAEV